MSDVQPNPLSETPSPEGDEAVVFTKDDWQNQKTSEAFGIKKSVAGGKSQTPGMKAVLVYHASFLESKKLMKQIQSVQPTPDLPEVISAMIDVCAKEPEVYLPKITKAILDRRDMLNALARHAAEEREAASGQSPATTAGSEF
ncbi:hypothetical protein [Burkholderia cenocepacia]|uniref:hypothetical protein n=1 Tax=Burkholderia cenocepacia TaxID=95486 RepID=UPI0022319C93|nr:hypothetical protein [Burkholderia cenocepacia]MCW3678645.1 hypothetical protein [Burkholderia cenocepacia]